MLSHNLLSKTAFTNPLGNSISSNAFSKSQSFKKVYEPVGVMELFRLTSNLLFDKLYVNKL